MKILTVEDLCRIFSKVTVDEDTGCWIIEVISRSGQACRFGPSRERLRSRTLPPGDCSLSARSHQETERGLGLACVFVPLFLDPQALGGLSLSL